jgi:fructose-bisphosphate aldolase class II
VSPRYVKQSTRNGADWQFNVNSWCRDKATHVYGAKFPETPFPDVQEEATEAFAAECERFMKLLGSSGKA